MGMVADNAKITNAINTIAGAVSADGSNTENYGGLAKNFQKAGSDFIESLNKTLDTFKGATKDALIEHKIGKAGEMKEGTLDYFVEKQIPDLIMSLGKLLEGNRSTIEKADEQLAKAIAGEGQS